MYYSQAQMFKLRYILGEELIQLIYNHCVAVSKIKIELPDEKKTLEQLIEERFGSKLGEALYGYVFDCLSKLNLEIYSDARRGDNGVDFITPDKKVVDVKTVVPPWHRKPFLKVETKIFKPGHKYPPADIYFLASVDTSSKLEGCLLGYVTKQQLLERAYVKTFGEGKKYPEDYVIEHGPKLQSKLIVERLKILNEADALKVTV